MSLVEKEKTKEPLALKILMNAFLLFYYIASPLLLITALLGMVFAFAISGILSVIYIFALPISMIVSICYMQKMYKKQEYAKVYLGMIPGIVAIFPFI